MAIIPTHGSRTGNVLTIILPENQGAGTVITGFMGDTASERVNSLIEYGGDTALFRLNMNRELVYLGTAQNYEDNPASYSIRMRISTYDTNPDHFGWHLYDYTVNIVVGDVDEQPTAISMERLVHQLAEGTYNDGRHIANVQIVDDALGDNHLTSFSESSIFEYRNTDGTAYVKGNVAQLWLKAGAVLDYETMPILEPSISARSNNNLYLSVSGHTFNVTDVDEKPIGITIEPAIPAIAEGTHKQDILLATITIDDDAQGQNTLALTEDNDDLFELRSDNGTAYAAGNVAYLWLKAGAVLDYETAQTLTATLTADGSGVGETTATAIFTMDVSDVDDMPTAVTLSQPRLVIPETLPGQVSEKRFLTDITFADVDGQANNTPYFYILGGDEDYDPENPPEHTHFTIEGDAETGWKLYLKAGLTLDYEAPNRLPTEAAIKVHTPDALGDEAVPAIFHLDLQDQLEFIDAQNADVVEYVFIVNEDADASAIIGRVDTRLPQGVSNELYALIDATDTFDIHNRFEGSNTFAEITLSADATLDYERTTEHSFMIHTLALEFPENGGGPLPFHNAHDAFTPPNVMVRIEVRDVNDLAPVFTGGDNILVIIDHKSGSHQLVHTAEATPDVVGDNVVYSLAGTDAARFTIDAQTGAIHLKDDPNFHTKSEYSITVQARVGQLTSTQAVALEVNDRDIAIAYVEVANLYEGVFGARTDTGYRVTILKDTVTYTLSDNRFEVVGDILYIKQGAVFDYETSGGTHELTITAHDSQNPNSPESSTITIHIHDVALPALRILDYVANDYLAHNQIVFDGGVRLSVDDEAAGDITYALLGSGAHLFRLDEDTGAVRAAQHLDPGRTERYQLELVAISERTGETVRDDFTVIVNEVQLSTPIIAPATINWNTPITWSLDELRDADGHKIKNPEIISAPQHGTVTHDRTSITYTPYRDYWGEDSIHVRVHDHLGASTTFAIDINVTPAAPAGYNLQLGTHGHDTLYGTAGNDYIVAGRGSDTINGGGGYDAYVIEIRNGHDTINDSTINGVKNTIIFKEVYSFLMHHDIIGSDLVIGIGHSIPALGVLPVANRVTIKDWHGQFDWFDFESNGSVTRYSAADFLRLFDKDYTPPPPPVEEEESSTPPDIL